MMVVLWTDALVWVLVALVMAYALHARRRAHLAAPWRRVGRSPSGMSAAVVIAAMALVALADSLHFRPRLPGGDPAKPAYAVQVLSVLDLALEPLRTRSERTYSAPFATRLYQRETVELGDGRVAREFARLRHGGAHLADEGERGADIARRGLAGAAGGVLAWGAFALAVVWLGARRARLPVRAALARIREGQGAVHWPAVLATLLPVCVLAGATVALAGAYHVLGTDKVGQDVLYLALKSVRTAYVIGGLTALVMLPLAVLLGIAAGYFRGWIDDLIQYVYTTINSIPGVLLIAAVVLMMQVWLDQNPDFFPTSAQRADARLLLLCVILGLTGWTGLARLLRAETLKVRELDYIQAARAFGVRDLRIITRHVLPNVMHIVVISLVMSFSGLVLAEAVLSYVGVGVDPTMTSYGTMINTARLEMAREPMVWWTLGAAFVFMFLIVLSANLLADAVRDAFDPRVRVGWRLVAGRARVAR
jgi:peptide/nickel transport system permease protein